MITKVPFYTGHLAEKKIIKEYSRKMYGRKKEYVDMEIEARMGIVREDAEAISPSSTPSEIPTVPSDSSS